MENRSEVSSINGALKALSREFGVERDRDSVLQIATLLIRLSKEGATCGDDLISAARPQLAELFGLKAAESLSSADPTR